MLKQLSQFKFNLNNRDILLFCENDTPLLDLKEVVFQMLKWIGQVEDNVKQQALEQAQAQSKVEPIASDEVKPE